MMKRDLSEEFTPKEIVSKLDEYIIGQKEAKKAVAIALRNRSRRKLVPGELQNEIYPKNILMIGNTGIGKTEIARRLAKLSDAPFIKIEATKFTEVGYVGRDVESIIRDLLISSMNDTRKKMMNEVREEAIKQTEEIILDALLPPITKSPQEKNLDLFTNQSQIENQLQSEKITASSSTTSEEKQNHLSKTREKFRAKLRRGELEDKKVEIEIRKPEFKDMGVIGVSGPEEMQQVGGMIKNIFEMMPIGKKNQTQKTVTIAQARKVLPNQIAESLLDQEKVTEQAIYRTENMGIVFLDEIDKIVTKGKNQGVDVSREGVQRDILPLVEGCVVNTRLGPVKTDHILFIAAGAFHISSPSDIIPELQGRFPIRVELKPLKQEELEQILKEPKNSLLKQYKALLATEGVSLDFTVKAIKTIAQIAYKVNDKTHNIGARRLSTVLEKLLEDYLFDATGSGKKIKIDEAYVKKKLNDIVQDEDLSRYIL